MSSTASDRRRASRDAADDDSDRGGVGYDKSDAGSDAECVPRRVGNTAIVNDNDVLDLDELDAGGGQSAPASRAASRQHSRASTSAARAARVAKANTAIVNDNDELDIDAIDEHAGGADYEEDEGDGDTGSGGEQEEAADEEDGEVAVDTLFGRDDEGAESVVSELVDAGGGAEEEEQAAPPLAPRRASRSSVGRRSSHGRRTARAVSIAHSAATSGWDHAGGLVAQPVAPDPAAQWRRLRTWWMGGSGLRGLLREQRKGGAQRRRSAAPTDQVSMPQEWDRSQLSFPKEWTAPPGLSGASGADSASEDPARELDARDLLGDADSVCAKLQGLSRLAEAGLLTPPEFAAAKRAVLQEYGQPESPALRPPPAVRTPPAQRGVVWHNEAVFEEPWQQQQQQQQPPSPGGPSGAPPRRSSPPPPRSMPRQSEERAELESANTSLPPAYPSRRNSGGLQQPQQPRWRAGPAELGPRGPAQDAAGAVHAPAPPRLSSAERAAGPERAATASPHRRREPPAPAHQRDDGGLGSAWRHCGSVPRGSPDSEPRSASGESVGTAELLWAALTPQQRRAVLTLLRGGSAAAGSREGSPAQVPALLELAARGLLSPEDINGLPQRSASEPPPQAAQWAPAPRSTSAATAPSRRDAQEPPGVAQQQLQLLADLIAQALGVTPARQAPPAVPPAAPPPPGGAAQADPLAELLAAVTRGASPAQSGGAAQRWQPAPTSPQPPYQPPVATIPAAAAQLPPAPMLPAALPAPGFDPCQLPVAQPASLQQQTLPPAPQLPAAQFPQQCYGLGAVQQAPPRVPLQQPAPPPAPAAGPCQLAQGLDPLRAARLAADNVLWQTTEEASARAAGRRRSLEPGGARRRSSSAQPAPGRLLRQRWEPGAAPQPQPQPRPQPQRPPSPAVPDRPPPQRSRSADGRARSASPPQRTIRTPSTAAGQRAAPATADAECSARRSPSTASAQRQRPPSAAVSELQSQLRAALSNILLAWDAQRRAAELARADICALVEVLAEFRPDATRAHLADNWRDIIARYQSQAERLRTQHLEPAQRRPSGQDDKRPPSRDGAPRAPPSRQASRSGSPAAAMPPAAQRSRSGSSMPPPAYAARRDEAAARSRSATPYAVPPLDNDPMCAAGAASGPPQSAPSASPRSTSLWPSPQRAPAPPPPPSYIPSLRGKGPFTSNLDRFCELAAGLPPERVAPPRPAEAPRAAALAAELRGLLFPLPAREGAGHAPAPGASRFVGSRVGEVAAELRGLPRAERLLQRP